MANKKIFVQMLFIMLMLPIIVCAQSKTDNDALYLSGAVPEENGKVVFSKDYVVTGMSQSDIYARLLKYLSQRMDKNGNTTSRVVFSNRDKGTIVAIADEQMIFNKTAISLDATNIKYQVSIQCSEGKCNIRIARINYLYRETEKYTAEDMIADKIALNKPKTKIYRGYLKWRCKTVDLADTYFTEIKDVLSKDPNAVEQKEQPVTEKSGTVVIAKQVPRTSATEPVNIIKESPVSSNTITPLHSFTPIDIPQSVLNSLYNAKAVIYMQNGESISCERGMALGYIDAQPVAFSFLGFAQQLPKFGTDESYTLKFISPENNREVMKMECSFISTQTEGGMKVIVGRIKRALAQ